MKDISSYIKESVFDKDLAKNAAEIKIDPTDITKRDEVIIFARSLPYEFKEEESGWGEKNSYAFSLKFNKHLSLMVDFVNRIEFIYIWYEDDTHVISEITSTREIGDISDWRTVLDPKWHVRKLRGIRKTGRNSAYVDKMRRIADKIDSLI